jgi:predicted anti-sigma-YlaC factor YlaD
MCCEEMRQSILAQTLEGEVAPTSATGRHLQECPACRDFWQRLNAVDAVLRALPLAEAPPTVTRRILEEVPPSSPPVEEQFLPWMLWVPAASLLIGLIWAYLALLWQRWPDLVDSVSPALSGWPAHTESWLGSNKSTLGTVSLSVAGGILLTVLGVIAGLYVGRRRVSAGR